MDDPLRLQLATLLKRRYAHPALWAYIDAAETEIMDLRMRARPYRSSQAAKDVRASYMREYRRKARVAKLLEMQGTSPESKAEPVKKKRKSVKRRGKRKKKVIKPIDSMSA
jgi:hypothetical protein